MNPEADQSSPQGTKQSGWIQPILTLVSSRLELIQYEFRQAARNQLRTLVALLAAGVCIFFTWALSLAGAIAAIATVSGWPWHLVALSFAAVHLIAAVILFKTAKGPQSAAFPITRSEFEKDREWLESLQNKQQ